MATIAFQSPSAARPGHRLSGTTSPWSSGPVAELAPGERLPTIEYLLPVSGCRLDVIDLPDGARVGRLYGPGGDWLAEARCERAAQVSGWCGRTGVAGTAWALAFGAGGSHEAVDVRFASLRARRVVPVVSDHHGLWVAEVAGAFRAATILSPSATTTLRLHYTS